MIVLGLQSGFTIDEHDPGAALIRDGELISVCEEERFVGVKNAKGHLPINSIKACLKEAQATIYDVDLIIHPGDSFQNLPEHVDGYLKHYFHHAPPIQTINHQLAHLASAYYHSAFDEAMCLSYDGYGDQLSAALASANAAGIQILETQPASNSLGVFYSLMTSYLGFTVDRDEYKVMGLSAYGKEGVDIQDILAPTKQGYIFNQDYLPVDHAIRNIYEPFYTEKLTSLLGPPRIPGSAMTQHYKDVAYASQKQLEACAIALVTYLHQKTGLRKLCIAGGVGLNCNVNYRLSQLDFIDEIFIQPAASDRGIALGCALYGSQQQGKVVKGLDNAFKGPSYSADQIANALQLTGSVYREVDSPTSLAAQMLAEGKILAWHQGRSEFGPRALGHRSILADPRHPDMKDEVNLRIKFREEFRPFAPSVLSHRAADLFETESLSPYMTVSYPVKPAWRDQLGAVTHVDGTSRIQTVDPQSDPIYHQLIVEFERLTGVPAVLNTSFNVRSQPIVETPLQALATFASSGLDVLFMDHFVIEKSGRSISRKI